VPYSDQEIDGIVNELSCRQTKYPNR